MRLVFRPHAGPAWLTAKKVGFCGLVLFFCFWTELLSGEELGRRCERPTLMFLVPFRRVLTACPWRSSTLCREDVSHLLGAPAGVPLPAKQLSVASLNSSCCCFLSLVLTHLPSPVCRLPAAADWPFPPREGVINPRGVGSPGYGAHPTDSRRQIYLNTYLPVKASSLSGSYF